MVTPWFATRAMVGTCLVTACLLQPCNAQSTKADGLREQFEAILGNDDLNRLDQIRQLRELIDREEAAILEKSVAEWIEQLGGTEFATREMAQKNLIEAGQIAIAAVAQGAKRDDRECAERCLSILTAIAKSDDSAAVASAMEALQRLSQTESSIGLRAAEALAKLNETDEDRALAALAAVGARVHKNHTGDVSMISASRGGFSDREIKLLNAFPRLTMLTVFGGDVTDAGLEGLREVKGLRHLSLLRTSITDVGLAKLATHPNLEFLTLGSEKVTAEGLRKLKDSRSLQTLSLFDVILTDPAVEVLNSLNIRRLSLHLKNASDDDLRLIGKLSKLSYLTLNDSPNLTDEGLAAIAHLPLGSLNIPASKVTNEGLRHLSKMTSLTTLFLGGAQITDDGLDHFKSLQNLTHISLMTTSVTDAGVAKLQAALPNLKQAFR